MGCYFIIGWVEKVSRRMWHLHRPEEIEKWNHADIWGEYDASRGEKCSNKGSPVCKLLLLPAHRDNINIRIWGNWFA